MFYTMLKKRIATNYQKTGGFIGLLGFLAVFVVMTAPPFAVLKLMDVPPFTAMRLLVPFVWIAYLLPGSRMLPERLTPMAALRLAVWPLLRA